MSFDSLEPFFDLDEFAVSATWGAYTENVILSNSTLDILGNRARSIEYVAIMPIQVFPGIEKGAMVEIGDSLYRVREHPTYAGLLKRIELELI